MSDSGRLAGPGTATRGPFGLCREWLTHDGVVLPSLLLLSHDEQLARLRASCPEAVPVAAVAGDLCLDRMLLSRPLRPVYRRAFGVHDGQRLLLVSSTWGPRSLFGAGPELVERLARELPLDDYRIVVALHPNVWDHHSPWQIDAWLHACRRAGALVVPPDEGWRAGLIGADVVLGDHGSVSFYGVALGRPLLLASFPENELDPASPVAMLGRLAPRLAPGVGLASQLDAAIEGFAEADYAPVTALASASPGRAAPLLRPMLYRLMNLPEPPPAADVAVVPIPPHQPPRPAAYWARASWSPAGADGWQVEVSRHQVSPPDADLLVELARARGAELAQAAVVVHRAEDDALEGPAWSWAGDEPLPRLAVTTLGPRRCQVWARAGGSALLTAVPDRMPPGWDIAVLGCAVLGWLNAGGSLRSLPERFDVRVGGRRTTVHARYDGSSDA